MRRPSYIYSENCTQELNMGIAETYRKIREEIPENVTIVAAVKTRSPEEVMEFIEAGGTDIGENYVQEAERMRRDVGDAARKVRWHLIGHLQTNKINKGLELFDVLQTVDSLERAAAVNARAARCEGRVVPVYLEINIGDESTKAGLLPVFDEVLKTAEGIAGMEHVRLEGLMTMGPVTGNPEDSRSFFRRTREIYDGLRDRAIPGVTMSTLSMGMSDSYRVAIEEGSTMVRLGTVLFGAR